MKQDIFTQVGKQTPFRTPEGFFSKQERTLKMIIGEVTPMPVIRPLRRKWFYAAAASIILIGVIYGVTRLLMQPSADSAPVYSQTSSASDDWSDFADADIFMDNMNW